MSKRDRVICAAYRAGDMSRTAACPHHARDQHGRALCALGHLAIWWSPAHRRAPVEPMIYACFGASEHCPEWPRQGVLESITIEDGSDEHVDLHGNRRRR